MTKYALLPLLLILAACATPRERCIAAVTRDLSNVEKLIAETKANLARGYAIEREPYTTFELEWCLSRGSKEGDLRWTWCRDTVTRYRDKPVAIDRATEERKLRELRATRTRLTRQSAAQVAQCQARYPEA